MIPIIRLLAFDPPGVLDDRISRRGNLGGAFWSVEAFDRLERVAVLAEAQAVTDDLKEINKHLVPEQRIHLVLAGIVARAQSSNRADLVRGVMVDVHAGVVLPSIEDPVHEAFEGQLFLLPVMGPPIDEVKGIRLLASSGADSKQIFQSAGNQRVALHVEEDIRRMVGRKCREAHSFAIRTGARQDFVARRGIGISNPIGPGLTL